MKIAVSGKGGVGKTTFASFLIRALANEGRKVLAIDADPDANLAQALGVKNSEEIVPISQMKELIEERTEAKTGTMGSFFKLNPKVSDLPVTCKRISCIARRFSGWPSRSRPNRLRGASSTVSRSPAIRAHRERESSEPRLGLRRITS